jgi:thioredoxin reductase
MTATWDAIVIGGGPAGLSAALWLARYRRRTLILDEARGRNEDAWAVHGYPGIEDLQPQELRRRLREQAMSAGALLERRRVQCIRGRKEAFEVEDVEGDTAQARRIVLAYGRTDRIPDVPGLRELYGTSVFHCPDCDGPSLVDGRVGVIGHDRAAAALALYLLTWCRRVLLLTHGLEPDLGPSATDVLARHGVTVETRRLVDLVGLHGTLRQVRLEGGATLDLDALFFHWGSDPAAELGPMTGCLSTANGDLEVNRDNMETSVPGIYAAGDIVGRPYLAIAAAADGVRAALSIHRSLLPDEIRL